MQEKITSDDWSQWVSSPVTKAVVGYLKQAQERAIEEMLNLDVNTSDLEHYALRSMSLRYFIDGIAQATDLEDLADVLVEEEADER